MKVELIHKYLGVKMWVTESEVEKFIAAGHKLAAPSVNPTEKRVDVEVEEEPKETKATKKTSRKK